MTVREASEWVYKQTIAEELLLDELVAAFTALTGRTPLPTAASAELFRRCADIVMGTESPSGTIRPVVAGG